MNSNHTTPESIDAQIALALHHMYFAKHYDLAASFTGEQHRAFIRNFLAAAFHADRNPAFATFAPALRQAAALHR